MPLPSLAGMAGQGIITRIADFPVRMPTPADNPGSAAQPAPGGWHSFTVTHQFALVVNGLEMVAIIALLGSSWNTARFDTTYALLYGVIAALLALNIAALTSWRGRRGARLASAAGCVLILLYVAAVAVAVALAWSGGNPFGLVEALLAVLLALPPLFVLAALRALGRPPVH